MSSRLVIEQVLGWGMLAVILAVVFLPAGASVASTHDNLMFKDEQHVTADMHEAADWMVGHTQPTSLFLASPEPPFWIPALTGRAVLRSNFWLSPDDIVLADVKAAFQGNRVGQEKTTAQADYIVLRPDEKAIWDPVDAAIVFENSDVVIYRRQPGP